MKISKSKIVEAYAQQHRVSVLDAWNAVERMTREHARRVQTERTTGAVTLTDVEQTLMRQPVHVTAEVLAARRHLPLAEAQQIVCEMRADIVKRLKTGAPDCLDDGEEEDDGTAVQMSIHGQHLPLRVLGPGSLSPERIRMMSTGERVERVMRGGFGQAEALRIVRADGDLHMPALDRSRAA